MATRPDTDDRAGVGPVECLVVVDVQSGLVEGPGAIPDAARVLDRIGHLLAAARQAEAMVVHVRNDGGPGADDERGRPGWRLVLDTRPDLGETILDKDEDDSFEGTDLAERLEERGVGRIAVVGMLSEMCVGATVRGALRGGFRVVLPRDAHGTFDVDDIPAETVRRIAEHALGDEVEIVDADDVRFTAPPRSV